MRKLLIPLLAIAALALPTSAFAWGGHDGHHVDRDGRFKGRLTLTGDITFSGQVKSGNFAKLSGTGSSFSGATATTSGTISSGSPLSTGTYSATLTNDTAHAMSKTFDEGTASCAPSTGTLALTSGSQTASLALTGKTCTFTPTSGAALSVFFGTGTATGALSGTERVVFKEDSAGNVTGSVSNGGRCSGGHHEDDQQQDNDNDGD